MAYPIRSILTGAGMALAAAPGQGGVVGSSDAGFVVQASVDVAVAPDAAYALLRRFLTRVAEPRRINYDTWRLAATSGYNYFIVLTLVLVATAGISSIAGVNELMVKRILQYEIAVIFAVFLLRRTQILSNACNQFTAFLYLCALEILPAGLLVASAIIF